MLSIFVGKWDVSTEVMLALNSACGEQARRKSKPTVKVYVLALMRKYLE